MLTACVINQYLDIDWNTTLQSKIQNTSNLKLLAKKNTELLNR